jgi:hypothetical protein
VILSISKYSKKSDKYLTFIYGSFSFPPTKIKLHIIFFALLFYSLTNKV